MYKCANNWRPEAKYCNMKKLISCLFRLTTTRCVWIYTFFKLSSSSFSKIIRGSLLIFSFFIFIIIASILSSTHASRYFAWNMKYVFPIMFSFHFCDSFIYCHYSVYCLDEVKLVSIICVAFWKTVNRINDFLALKCFFFLRLLAINVKETREHKRRDDRKNLTENNEINYHGIVWFFECSIE